MTSNAWRTVIQPQPMFDVLAQANELERHGHYLARMEIGGTPGFENGAIKALLAKYSGISHQYSPSDGEPLLIDAVRASQWLNYSESEFKITIGPANFLILAALAATTTPGDLVLIPNPGFPTYKLACDFLGLRSKTYSSIELISDPSSPINQAIFSSPDFPKVIIVNNPSNPIGVAVDGSLISTQIQGLVAKGTEVLIDETYINLVYCSIDAAIPDIPATRIRSFSKEHCAPGLRIGYALSNKKTSETMSNLMSLTISCAPRFIQLAVAEYLNSAEHTRFYENVKHKMLDRFRFLETVVPTKMLLIKPNSAFYALIETGDDLKSFDFLLARNVSTCPGSKFGTNSQHCLRVSLAGSEENIVRDMEMLGRALFEWQEIQAN
jgi:aspartate/methionine/tyrosine aminotransferase